MWRLAGNIHRLHKVLKTEVRTGCHYGTDAMVRHLWNRKDRMFSLNTHLFESGISFPVLCAKTAVCQFIWTPLIFAPLGSIVYFWMGRDFSFVRFRREMPKRFYSGLVLPNLLANWVLWIPVTFAIHMFPTPLQIQLSGMASALFSLMLLAMGRDK